MDRPGRLLRAGASRPSARAIRDVELAEDSSPALKATRGFSGARSILTVGVFGLPRRY